MEDQVAIVPKPTASGLTVSHFSIGVLRISMARNVSRTDLGSYNGSTSLPRKSGLKISPKLKGNSEIVSLVPELSCLFQSPSH